MQIYPTQHQPHRFPGRNIDNQLGILQGAAEQIGAALRQHHPGGGRRSGGGIADNGIDIELQHIVWFLLPLGVIRRHGFGHGGQRFFLLGVAAAAQ